MQTIREKYIVDRNGKRLGVYLEISDYKRLLSQAEMAESVAAYDAARRSGEEAIPFSKAVAELRKKKR